MTKRRKFTPEFKAQVVLEMLTEQKSAAQASREYRIKDSVLSRWKQEFIERSPMLFEQGSASDDRDQHIAELERLVGRQAMELEMAKKVSRFLNSPRNGSEGW
jgi:transposase-like protein